MYNKTLKKIISLICILLSLSFFLWMFSGCNSDSNEEILGYVWDRDKLIVNGNEYVLVVNDNWVRNNKTVISNGIWWWKDTDKMKKIGTMRGSGDWSFFAEYNLYASNEEPPIYLYLADDGKNVCYMIKGHTLPSKYTATFSYIDFGKNIEDLFFDKSVSMKNMISYENTLSVETCESIDYCRPEFYYSENEVLYLVVDICVINEEFYILLDNVYYPIVMPEILDRLNAAK